MSGRRSRAAAGPLGFAPGSPHHRRGSRPRTLLTGSVLSQRRPLRSFHASVNGHLGAVFILLCKIIELSEFALGQEQRGGEAARCDRCASTWNSPGAPGCGLVWGQVGPTARLLFPSASSSSSFRTAPPCDEAASQASGEARPRANSLLGKTKARGDFLGGHLRAGGKPDLKTCLFMLFPEHRLHGCSEKSRTFSKPRFPLGSTCAGSKPGLRSRTAGPLAWEAVLKCAWKRGMREVVGTPPNQPASSGSFAEGGTWRHRRG